MWIGVDPGTTGALAVVGDGGELMEVHDLPRLRVTKGTVRGTDGVSKPRQVAEIDGYELARLIDDITTRLHVRGVWCEKVGAMPTDAKASAFAFGLAYGEIRGVIRAHFLPLSFVSPVTWRRALGVGKAAGKDASRALAQSLWPQSGAFARAKDEHRAEAALIAEYARQLAARDAA